MKKRDELELPVIETEDFILRNLEMSEAQFALDYFLKNKEFLALSMPSADDKYFNLESWKDEIDRDVIKFLNDEICRLFVFPKNKEKVIGTIQIKDIYRGSFQGCSLGYAIDEDYQGKGYMTQILTPFVDYVFRELNMHKITACYIPDNLGSARVLEKLGFKKTGLLEKEFFIEGEWRDHMETRLINPKWKNNIV